jgi:hypothetical protein
MGAEEQTVLGEFSPAAAIRADRLEASRFEIGQILFTDMMIVFGTVLNKREVFLLLISTYCIWLCLVRSCNKYVDHPIHRTSLWQLVFFLTFFFTMAASIICQ